MEFIQNQKTAFLDSFLVVQSVRTSAWLDFDAFEFSFDSFHTDHFQWLRQRPGGSVLRKSKSPWPFTCRWKCSLVIENAIGLMHVWHHTNVFRICSSDDGVELTRWTSQFVRSHCVMDYVHILVASCSPYDAIVQLAVKIDVRSSDERIPKFSDPDPILLRYFGIRIRFCSEAPQ